MNRNMAVAMVLVLVAIAAVSALLIPNNQDGQNQNNQSDMSQMSEEEMDGMQSSQSEQPASNGSAVATKEAEIENFDFKPATIKVKIGDTVTWTNKDTAKHDVVDDNDNPDGPKGPLLSKGESYSFTFKKAGTYNYHCSPHPYMKGTVIVE
jgi:amicyanin